MVWDDLQTNQLRILHFLQGIWLIGHVKINGVELKDLHIIHIGVWSKQSIGIFRSQWKYIMWSGDWIIHIYCKYIYIELYVICIYNISIYIYIWHMAFGKPMKTNMKSHRFPRTIANFHGGVSLLCVSFF